MVSLFGATSAQGSEAISLFRKGQFLGTLSAVRNGPYTAVDVVEASNLIGASSVEKNDTLIITLGKSKLQLVENAAAAWLGVELLPMASPAAREGSRWMLDSSSTLKLLNGLLEKSGGTPSLQWGEGGSKGVPPPSTTVPKSGGKGEVPPGKGTESPLSALPVLNEIRWGGDEENLRIVFDLSGSGDPKIRKGTHQFTAEFASSSRSVPGLKSPVDEVRLAVTNFGNRLSVEITSALPLKDVLFLEGPRRIVLDFVRKNVSSLPPRQEEPITVDDKGPAHPMPKKNTKMIVAIDPGHGGKDPGAVANGIREKDINLTVGRLLKERLDRMGYDARLTRNTDIYLTLQKRTELANQWNADAFISVHANALPPGRHATGMEIYIMALPTDEDAMQLAKIENAELVEGNGDSAKAADKRTQMLLSILGDMQQNAKISESTGFAEYIFNAGKSGGVQMRRVAQAPFFVLRGAAMPAVLVETGFLTEKKEAKRLATKSYQEKMAQSIATGVHRYLSNN